MNLDVVFIACYDAVMRSRKRVYLIDTCASDLTYLRSNVSLAVSIYRAVMYLISASNDKVLNYANSSIDLVVAVANHGRVLGLVD